MVAAVGIDLGTTNTVVSAVKDGWPVTLVDSEGRRLLPSVVSFHPSGKVLVGHSAKDRRIVDPTSTILSVKRLIGRPWDSPEVQRAIKSMPFEIAAGDGQEVQVVARGERYTLPEISAFILRRAKAIAEAALGEPVRQAVITVPANFNDPQREATKLAGKLAGLDVLRILSEPTAAALAYGESAGKKERIAVYDLGGGTFDVTILDADGTVFQVLATGGDTALGGDDIDDLVAALMNDHLLRQFRYDARTDPTARATLKQRAEELKILLSANTQGDVALSNLVRGEGGQFLPAAFKLDRTTLETISSPLLERTLETCRRTVEKVGMTIAQVDRILLVGGSTRMPLVGQRVEDWFGRKVSARVNPDEVVAHGAAVQAASLARGAEVSAVPSFRPRPSFSFAIDVGAAAVGTEASLFGEPPSPSAVPRSGTLIGAGLVPGVAVALPPKSSGGNTAAWGTVLPPTLPQAAESPPAPPVRPSGATWPPAALEMPAPPPSTPASAAPAAPASRPAPPTAAPSSQSSRPPLSQDQEAMLRAFLGAGGAAPAAPASSPAPPVALTPQDALLLEFVGVAPAPTPPPSTPQDALLKAFLGADAPASRPSAPASKPPPTTSPAAKTPADIESELRAFLSTGGDASRSVTPFEGIVAAPASRQPPPRTTDSPIAPSARPGPVITDRPPEFVPRRSKAPPLPSTGGHTFSGVGPPAPSLPLPAAVSASPPADAVPSPLPAVPDLPGRAAPPLPELPPLLPLQPSKAAPPPVPQRPPPPAAFALQPGPAPAPPPPRPPPTRAVNPLLIDVTPLSLGVETVGGFCDVIIRANSPVPCDRNRVFQTASDNQTAVVVKICQGESQRFAENATLGDLRLSGFRPAPRGEVAVTVMFEIDADGILNVQAKEVGTGRTAAARIELHGGQNDAKKVQAMMDRQAEREVV